MPLWYAGHSPKLFTLVSKNTPGENHAVVVCRAFIKTVHSGRLGYHWREPCRCGMQGVHQNCSHWSVRIPLGRTMPLWCVVAGLPP